MTYQDAKARIKTLSPFAFIRPDSFTRRGDTMIARRRFAPKYKGIIGIQWAASISLLFPEAKIVRTHVDTKHNARCWIRFK